MSERERDRETERRRGRERTRERQREREKQPYIYVYTCKRTQVHTNGKKYEFRKDWHVFLYCMMMISFIVTLGEIM